MEVAHEAAQPAGDVKALQEVGFLLKTGAMAVVDAVERDARGGFVSASR